MQHQKLSVVKTFALLLTANLLLAQETVPEVLPQVIEQELKSRGMTAQEAVMKAAQLGIGSDNRTGLRFLFAGVGYGGLCFPKDMRTLICSADGMGLRLRILSEVDEVQFASS